MELMKALYFGRTGNLDELVLKDVPEPRPAAGEALVRIKAAAVNPSDPKSVLGKMAETTAPRVPGRDFSGVVVEGPARWKGKYVMGTGGDLGSGRDGSHAELVAIPVDALVEKPAGLGFPQAAALGVSYLAAWCALVTAGRVGRQDTLLIIGAAGAVGSSAAKIARHLGARRILGTLRNQAEEKRGAGVPVDDWIDLSGKPLADQVSALTAGRGVDLVLDTVGGALFEAANRCLAQNGRHVAIASNPPEVSFNLVDFYHRQARLIGVDTFKLSFRESAEILGQVVPLVMEGTLTAPELEPISLERAVQAYRAVLEGRARRKPVIVFGA